MRWSAGAEDVWLELGVRSSARQGALIFPVPDPAATVELGPATLFDELDSYTAPRQVTVHRSRPAGNGAGAPAGAAPVEVLKRQRLGPLDVVTLSAHDPGELTRWLNDNGFATQPGLASAVTPYTAQGWSFIAVRIAPEAGVRVNGRLDPLHLRFAVAKPVYPMSLTALASSPVSVRLYVLAAHRQSVTPVGVLHLEFAGRVDRASLSAGSALAALAGPGSDYLTRYGAERVAGSSVAQDVGFVAASDDGQFREETEVVIYDKPVLARAGFLAVAAVAGLVLTLLLCGAAIALLIVLFVARRRRSRLSP